MKVSGLPSPRYLRLVAAWRLRKRETLIKGFRHLDTQKPDVLRFVSDPAVPLTDNLTERDTRMMKLRQKIPGELMAVIGAVQGRSLSRIPKTGAGSFRKPKIATNFGRQAAQYSRHRPIIGRKNERRRKIALFRGSLMENDTGLDS